MTPARIALRGAILEAELAYDALVHRARGAREQDAAASLLRRCQRRVKQLARVAAKEARRG